MVKPAIACAASLLLLSAPEPVAASSSDWFATQGGSVRIITTGKPDAAGRLYGMLDIALKPGWKTYWRDPGDTGVPPEIDVGASTNIAGAELDFPAPQRHDDGGSVWAGYDHPVALPIIFTLLSPNQSSIVEASVFLGICETICIPVQAKLTLDPAADPDNPDDEALVRMALDALPAPARPDFGVSPISGGKDEVLVEARFPADPARVDFFLAASDGYSFAAPRRIEKDGKLLFSIEILDRPAAVPEGSGLHYTLTSDRGAVAGLLAFP